MSLRTENNFTRAEKTHPPDPLERQIAYERVEAVKNDMMPSSGAPLLSILSYVYKTIYATCFDTMCVSLSADGLPCLGVGPLFTASLDDLNSVMFVLFHEAMHLMRRHLVKDDRAKRRDSRYQMAQEAWINYYVMRFARLPMPTITYLRDAPEGFKVGVSKQTGVDPKKLYDDTKKDLAKQGITMFPSYHEFYLSEDTVYEWICQVEKDSRSTPNFCAHGDDSGEEGEGEGSDLTPVLDTEAVADVANKALEALVGLAAAGGDRAKAELEALVGAAGDDERAQQIFGSAGAYKVLGQTTPERKSDLWDRLAAFFFGRLTEAGERLTLNANRPRERILVHRGNRKRAVGVAAIDSSGSMVGGHALEQITRRIGKTKAKVQWLWWDGVAAPFKPGDPMVGGGGTDCRVVDQWIADNMRRHPDFVAVITDGYFTHFTPRQPSKWVWLVTKDGDDWMSTGRDGIPVMKTIRLPW